MKINKILKAALYALSGKSIETPKEIDSEIVVDTFGGCCHRSDGRGSKVETLPGGKASWAMADLDYFHNKVAEGLKIDPEFLKTELQSFLQELESKHSIYREQEEAAKKMAEEAEKKAIEDKIQADKDAIELQKTIIQWQKLAGVEPEKTLDLLIPIKEGKNERRRSVNFNSTADMVAYLEDKGFVPYDLEYVEEARTGKYRFVRIKKNDVKNFFEFPDATFNGPEFYTPYKPDYSRPTSFGPYLAPHQLNNPIPMTVEEIEAVDGKISTLSPLVKNTWQWDEKDGIFTPKEFIDFRDSVYEEERNEYFKEQRKKAKFVAPMPDMD